MHELSPLVTAQTLGFAHTLGEFGVVLMIGGAIPGVTKVASIALYDEVQKLDYASAHAFAAMLLVISFALLLIVTLLQMPPMWPAKPRCSNYYWHVLPPGNARGSHQPRQL